MKWPLVIVPVIASALWLATRKRSIPHTKVSPAPITAPKAQDSLELELRQRMEEFLKKDCFSLVVQPVVDFRTNTVSSGEVLARLNHPERGVIFPDDFLPTVDALGLYPRFDRYIFRKSCAWLSRALAEGDKLDCISCNFSRKTLSEEGIAQDLVKIADHYRVPHNALAVEITERERETNAQKLIENLEQLKASGFRIFLDDFGKGVTSVNDLMQYPLDIVKIDRSLLLNAETEQGANAYRALTDMAIKLGVAVVCEGIETEAQNRFAREAGCHYGQGFLFFKPTEQNLVFEMIQRSSILEENT